MAGEETVVMRDPAGEDQSLYITGDKRRQRRVSPDLSLIWNNAKRSMHAHHGPLGLSAREDN